jgi:hypothetical protein
MVGVRGFEPPTSRTRTVRSTKLSHTPALRPGHMIRHGRPVCQCRATLEDRSRNAGLFASAAASLSKRFFAASSPDSRS